MKIGHAGALLAALGLATAAVGQTVKLRSALTPDVIKKHKLVPTAPEVPDHAPPNTHWPEGYTPPADGLRAAVVTLYDNSNTGTVYGYNGTAVGVGNILNGVLEGVTFGPAWVPNASLSTVGICVHNVAGGAQSFKVFVRIWDTVNANAPVGTPAHSNQLPTGAPIDLFYTNGGAGFNVTAAYTVGFNLGLPAGIIPVDNNVGIEIRLVNSSVTTAADAANPANTHPNLAMDCMSIQSLAGGVGGNPGMPTVGAPFPADGKGHCWFDFNDPAATPPSVHDGLYFAGQISGVNGSPPDPATSQGEDLWDDDGANWANIYLKVQGEVPAVAPPNDNCASATNITMPGGAPSSTTLSNQTAVGATAEAVVPPACGVGNPATQAGVWYTFTGRGRVTTVSTCGPGSFDSVVRIYTGGCAAPVCVAGTDDAGATGCSGNFDAATTTFCAAAGTQYLIYVRPADGVSGGTYNLTVTETATTCPATCSLNASGATDLTLSNPNCGVPASPFGTCAGAQVVTDCATYFDRLASDGNVRGVDSFLYQLNPGSTDFTIKLTSESPMIAFVLLSGDPLAPCNGFLVASPGQFSTAGCVEQTLHITGATGGDSYLIQIAPAAWDPTIVCGAPGTGYRLTVSSDLCVTGPDCFTVGSAGANGPCGRPTHSRPTNAGHFVAGGPDGIADSTQCVGDWDGDGCVLPSDVAGFVASWFFSAQNPGNLDGDIDCSNSAEPADVAAFVGSWFSGVTNPSSVGC